MHGGAQLGLSITCFAAKTCAAARDRRLSLARCRLPDRQDHRLARRVGTLPGRHRASRFHPLESTAGRSRWEGFDDEGVGDESFEH